jgi:hypothetical protein
VPWKTGVIVPRGPGRYEEVSLVWTLEPLDKRCFVVRNLPKAHLRASHSRRNKWYSWTIDLWNKEVLFESFGEFTFEQAILETTIYHSLADPEPHRQGFSQFSGTYAGIQ